jgi:uncharacterized protein (TIGR00251 family)
LSRSSAEARPAPGWRRVGADGSLTLAIRAQPGAAKTEFAGIHGDAVRIRVAAAAVEGRANEALIAFLAASFDVPRRNVTLVRGERGRMKTVCIAAPTARPDRGWEKP